MTRPDKRKTGEGAMKGWATRRARLAMIPKLELVDLSKATKHEHPDIMINVPYLALIGGEYFAGTFSRQWFGWSFNSGWGASGHQFDAPGFNRSRWQGLWRVRDMTVDMWTLYDHPKDYPDHFVARRWCVDDMQGCHPTNDMFTADTLMELRALLPPGLTKLHRLDADDPKILEVWI